MLTELYEREFDCKSQTDVGLHHIISTIALKLALSLEGKLQNGSHPIIFVSIQS